MAAAAADGAARASSAAGRRRRRRLPDGKLKAFYRDRNLWVSDADGSGRVADHDRRQREGPHQVRHGELGLRRGARRRRPRCGGRPTAARSPTTASTRSQVPDYYLQLDQTKVQSTIDVEAYPKAGAPNPIVDLFVYDVASEEEHARSTSATASRSTTTSSATTSTTSSWSPDGTRAALQPHQPAAEHHGVRRRQSRRRATCRVIVREEWPTGWVENRPPMQFLKDNQRFIWESERNGFANYYLYDLTGKLHHAADDAHDVRGRRRSSRSTRPPACSSTWRATATTT